MQVCLMIEGQEGVTWEQWVALADACERGGIEGLFRSDHYLSIREDVDLGSLDAWTTLAGLAARTERIRLGTLVSPATFRHPSVVAKSVATVDHISNGRVELGLGAGWFEPEHHAYGFPFPDTSTRLDMLAEQLEIITRQWTEDSFDFRGRAYQLEGLTARPRPVQQPHPPVIVGGSGGRKSIALAARWANEYNTLFVNVEECRARRQTVEQAWEGAGRDPTTTRLSLMLTCIVARDKAELRERAARLLKWRDRNDDVDGFIREHAANHLVGLVDEVVDKLHRFAEVGVDRVMLQHLIHDDLDMVELIAQEIVPNV
jgi:F420-dependent oxidoreductase-like protein